MYSIILEEWNEMKQKCLSYSTSQKSPEHDGLLPPLLLHQVGCQPEENEDNKSEEESQGKTKSPLG